MIKTTKYNKGKKVSLVSILVNASLVFFKLFAGIFGQSSAMIADAVHTLSDLITDIIVILGLKYSTQPSDKKHPYGHEKIETLVSLILGIFLMGVGIKIGYDGIKTIFQRPSVSPTILALFAAVISLVSKEILYRYTLRIGKKINSRAVIANAWHHRSDALSSLVAFVGIAGSMMGFRMLDALAATFLAIFIIKIGVEISAGTTSELVESSVSEELAEKIRKIASHTPGLAGVHSIRARHIGSSIFAEIHIEVAADINVEDSHFIADEVERKIRKNIKEVKEVLVHVEPFKR
ncbi:cation transporter [Candidatus Aerophobetes bacterium]|nr:cation transporter [Candidatus Aerophobetes bacterium]